MRREPKARGRCYSSDYVGDIKFPTILVADVDRAHVIAMPDEPAPLLRAAQHAARDLAPPVPTPWARAQPIERADYEQTMAAARDHLGEETFASAWTQGRAMTAEQVLTTGERTIHPQQSQQNQRLLK